HSRHREAGAARSAAARRSRRAGAVRRPRAARGPDPGRVCERRVRAGRLVGGGAGHGGSAHDGRGRRGHVSGAGAREATPLRRRRRAYRELPLGRGSPAGARVVRPGDLACSSARAHVCAGGRRMVVSHRHGVEIGAGAGRDSAGALAHAALAGGAGRSAGRDPMDPVIAKGTCFPAFAFDVARAIDLDAAERRILAGTERQTVKQRRRAPANFEYRPAPLRVTRQGEPDALGAYRTAPTLELVLYDFGAISASYAVSIEGPLMGLPALAYALWGNERLVADARRHVEELMATVGNAAVRPRIADVVEDYSIFEIEAFAAPCPASALWTAHAHTVAQVLRAEPRTLSQQDVADGPPSR